MKNYLTEKRLKELVENLFPNLTKFYQKRIKIKNKLVIVDIFIEELKLFIEFDGYRHYSNTLNIIRDKNLDNYCKENNLTIIHIPYFIQLDDTMIDFYFKDYNYDKNNWNKIKNNYNYPHGFIDEKAMLPYDFCYLGIERFKQELKEFPIEVKEQVINTIKDKLFNLNTNNSLKEDLMLFLNL